MNERYSRRVRRAHQLNYDKVCRCARRTLRITHHLSAHQLNIKPPLCLACGESVRAAHPTHYASPESLP